MDTWSILQSYAICYGHLVYFNRFGILCQEKSGNPALKMRLNHLCTSALVLQSEADKFLLRKNWMQLPATAALGKLRWNSPHSDYPFVLIKYFGKFINCLHTSEVFSYNAPVCLYEKYLNVLHISSFGLSIRIDLIFRKIYKKPTTRTYLWRIFVQRTRLFTCMSNI
jgi:hypothetical protein